MIPLDSVQAQAAQSYRFSLSGLSLDAALRQYSRITGRQIIFRPETVAGRPAPKLIGTYDADTALALLLNGVTVRVEHVRPDVIVISAAGDAAQVSEIAPVQGRDMEAAAQASEPIVVTGTTIRGAMPAGASVTTIDRRAIDRSTRASVADVVSLLPQNSGATGSDAATLGILDRSSLNYSLASSPNLRGLGSDATLTLVNGRRQAGSGGRGDYSDLSTIPLAAVERIEVLKDGASAIYGSDAIGGVVNIILKQDYEGADTRLRSGIGTSGAPANYQASQLAGVRWGGGGVLVAYEYDRRGSLASSERAVTRSADLRPLGGSDWRSYLSAPGTVLRYDTVARAYVPAFAIPASTDRPSRQDFTPGRNLESQFELTDTLPLQERHSVYVRGDQEVASGIEFFLEGRWARRRFSYALPPSTATIAVTAANPYFASPDGTPATIIAYSFGDDLGPIDARGWVDAASITGGMTADIWSGWQLDAYFLHSRERSGSTTSNKINSSALSEALGTAPDNPATQFRAARDGYFNPFGSGMSNSQSVLRFIGSGVSGSTGRSSLATAVAKLDGPLLRLPAGSLRLAVGGAWRGETLESGGFNFDSGTAPRPVSTTYADRQIKAVFGELSIPVFDVAQDAGPGKLDLSAAIRHEEYSDFGKTTTPKVGATWRIAGPLSLRASWGRSFRAPALPEIYSTFGVSPTLLPTGAGTTTPVLFLSGGNPALKPETADTITGGLAFQMSRRVRLDINYFRTRFVNRIDRPALQSILTALTDASLSPFVERLDPVTNPADLARVQTLLADPGAVDVDALPINSYRAIVDGRYVNTSKVEVEGLDVEVDANMALGAGTISATAGASYLFRYSQQITPTAPTLGLVSTVGYPARFKSRSSLDWSDGGFGATLSATYVGSYRDIDSVPSRRVPAWLTFDLQLRATPQSARGFTLSLDARNLFDRSPPFVNRAAGVGYDPANADVLGRLISVQVSKTW
ncbi:TonB-dependent receptor [Sphingomonas sp. M1-B02]|uniref:TonB-dependent receptor n=1 Tax=Sphingomonas sp. M1-B02 TaxID=3114300 RepID=UPI00223F190D|nr:TonB-dependent receptor [Sphingomonas sp. S6-11]UZK67856.1 TonB-dependent receptor [Sphingomonas sp. S6-11]